MDSTRKHWQGAAAGVQDVACRIKLLSADCTTPTLFRASPVEPDFGVNCTILSHSKKAASVPIQAQRPTDSERKAPYQCRLPF